MTSSTRYHRARFHRALKHAEHWIRFLEQVWALEKTGRLCPHPIDQKCRNLALARHYLAAATRHLRAKFKINS